MENEARPQPADVPHAAPLPLQYASPDTRRVRRPVSFGEAMIVATACATVLTVVTFADADVTAACLGFLIWTIALLAWGARVLATRLGATRAPAQPEFLSWWRRAVLVFLAVTLIFGPRVARCPHATYVIFGPVPMRFGEGCNNPQRFHNLIDVLRSRR